MLLRVSCTAPFPSAFIVQTSLVGPCSMIGEIAR
jgi:hypothetical protein